jgi:hypothetical protein
MTRRFTRHALAALVFVLGAFGAVHGDTALNAQGHAVTLTAKAPSTARLAPIQPGVAPNAETTRVALVPIDVTRATATHAAKHDLHGEIAPRGPPSA